MPSASPSSRACPSPADQRVQEQAALWFARMRGEHVTEVQHAAFTAWLADDGHRREYEILKQVWEQSGQLAPQAGRKRSAITAATLAGVATLCAWLGFSGFDGRITSDPGERQHIRLADGSELDVAPHTRLRVKFNGTGRRLELDEGQLVVSVAPDPQRPFEVAAGGGVIRDIGTRFEVQADPERTRVVVAEGIVEINLLARSGSASRSVKAGEAADFDATNISLPQSVDTITALAWTKGQLGFDAAPLADVVSALNRYRKTPIALDDPTLARIRISGVFLLDDEAAALRALQQVAPVRFVPAAGRVLAQPDKR